MLLWTNTFYQRTSTRSARFRALAATSAAASAGLTLLAKAVARRKRPSIG